MIARRPVNPRVADDTRRSSCSAPPRRTRPAQNAVLATAARPTLEAAPSLRPWHAVHPRKTGVAALPPQPHVTSPACLARRTGNAHAAFEAYIAPRPRNPCRPRDVEARPALRSHVSTWALATNPAVPSSPTRQPHRARPPVEPRGPLLPRRPLLPRTTHSSLPPLTAGGTFQPVFPRKAHATSKTMRPIGPRHPGSPPQPSRPDRPGGLDKILHAPCGHADAVPHPLDVVQSAPLVRGERRGRLAPALRAPPQPPQPPL